MFLQLVITVLFTAALMFVTPVRASANMRDAGSAPATGVMSGVDGPVHALAAGISSLYAGGSFANAAGVPTANVAMWNGTVWEALGAGTNGIVRVLALDNGILYAGGEFTLAGTTPVHNVASWNGTLWSDVGGGVDGGVNGATPVVKSIAFDAAGILIGGIFSQVGPATPANGLARWTGSAWDVLGGIPPGIEHDIRAIVPLGGKIYVGGVLRFPGSTRPSEATLAKATPFVLSNHAGSANADDECTGCASVDALAGDGTNLFVAGAFTDLGDITVEITRYQIVELIDATISFGLGSGENTPSVASGGVIKAMAFSGGVLYAGGNLTQIRGVAISHVARWDGSAWSAMGSAVPGMVRAMVLWDGVVYMGGDFTTANGVDVNHVARWSGSAWGPVVETPTPVEVRSWGSLKAMFRKGE